MVKASTAASKHGGIATDKAIGPEPLDVWATGVQHNDFGVIVPGSKKSSNK